METTQFKPLFEQVNTLNNHYKRINDLTGENFNIFRILKLEASEVRLHSDRDLIYGFRILKSYTNDSISSDLINNLRLLPNNTKSGTNTWPRFKYMDQPYNDWRKLETWQAITDGTMMTMIKEKVDTLLQLTDGMEL